MRQSQIRYLGLAAAALLLVAACGSTTGGTASPAAKVVKVGLVTAIGGLNDKSFNHLADVGLEKAKTDFHIQGDVTESHTGGDYVPNLTHFATLNYDLVIGVGFLMQQAVGAMVGVIAGMMEKDKLTPGKTNVISAVGGVSIPPVNHYIAGYKWAATMEDPGIKVLVGYSNDFADPAKCKTIANAQIGQNHSEIVFQVAGGCGLGALQAAGQAHVYSVGVDADQAGADPSVIASALKKVDVATFTAIQAEVNGTFASG